MECMQSIHIMATFQLTTSQGGRHGGFNLQTTDKAFQLTTSRGGRHQQLWWHLRLDTFQLTTSRGGRHAFGCLVQCFWHFNSRPHEEVDLSTVLSISDSVHFNSRPHEEVDRVPKITNDGIITFQLTTSRGGRPRQILNRRRKVSISTHDLARRSTGTIVHSSDRRLFQLTTSRGGRHYPL